MRRLAFKHALTPGGIVSGAIVEVGADGTIAAVGPGAEPPYDGDFALPALANAHSHAFQRALVGRGEARAGDDSFWSWREAMYGLAARVDPESMYAVARMAYTEMLGSGFTAVAEFHYLHHLPGGGRGTAMADAVVAAARDTGIRLRLLPVYYHAGGFDRPVGPSQARFVHDTVDAFMKLVDAIDHPSKGVAAHSLRAVPLEHLRELVGEPIHIHVSEQSREVEECVAVHGKRPIELLADTVDLDDRWTLVHATHADETELRIVERSGATVALCPLTEAYLGDGVFPATRYSGSWAIGTDSNVRIDAIEELRMLEYGQRLVERKRARLADGEGIGHPLWRRAAEGGARAAGFRMGAIAPGHHADLVVLDEARGPWAGLPVERWLDAWLTGGDRTDLMTVIVGGDRLVESGAHRDHDEVRAAFSATTSALWA